MMQQEELCEQIQETLVAYLEDMDDVTPGVANIFRRETSKEDLETKVWHYFHHLESAEYHCARVKDMSLHVRREVARLDEAFANGHGDVRMTFQDRPILFEISAFLGSSRSALDLLASIVSRYIKGTDLDTFRKAVRVLAQSEEPTAKLIRESWSNWAEDLVEYRDYLFHRGTLHPATGTYMWTKSETVPPDWPDSFASPFGDIKPVVFPVPIRPDATTSLTRLDVLRLRDDHSLYGVMVTVCEAQITEGTKVQKKRWVKRELAPGYVEAEDFCEMYMKNLSSFSLGLFSLLRGKKFTHLESAAHK